MKLGTQTPLTAASTAADTSFTWMTSDPAIATVDTTGMVNARGTGTVTITAVGMQSGLTGVLVVSVSADDIPFLDEWTNSAHNRVTAEAFTHWDDDGAVPTSCARCHTTPGFRDFLGDDGTAAGVVDNAAPLGTTVECLACHNTKALELSEVTFPSGVTVPNSLAEEPLGREAVCMTCHQGRASKDSVDAAIAGANPPDDDTVMPDQGFINVHYFPAAATRYGGTVRGGYLYDGEAYDVLFQHVPGLERCQDCHNPHTLKIKLDVCSGCHNVSTMEDLHDIRMISSATRDYDGDGNLVEGLYFEIQGLKTKLLMAIQEYATEVIGSGILYDSGSYPYWFVDTNGNGVADTGEIGFGNRYTTYTARLLKATFNYQYASKDPGGFAHNGKFIIQLLHDSINDCNSAITNKVDMSAAVRNDRGHFDGTAEAFRHWDDDGEVSASCARCHGASKGFDEYLHYGTNIEKPIANGFDCAVCHTTFDTFETRRILQVEFPGGKKTPLIDAATPTDDPLVQANICITCHQGRTSKADIDELIAERPNSLSFQNVHYLAAAATLFGTEAQVGYEYAGKTYSGKFPHVSSNPTNTNHCVFCHSPKNTQHTFRPEDNINLCRNCHRAQDNSTLMDVRDIRLVHDEDYNGNGRFPGAPGGTETLRDEVDGLADRLLTAIQGYATATATGSEGQMRQQHAIVYHPTSYPYFFRDLNGNGTVDPGENIFPNRYSDWDGKMIRAAHNFQQTQKEHGAWAHNFPYVIQLLFDSIEDVGGSTAGLIRPAP